MQMAIGADSIRGTGTVYRGGLLRRLECNQFHGQTKTGRGTKRGRNLIPESPVRRATIVESVPARRSGKCDVRLASP